MDKQTAAQYIRSNFRSDDRLAVVLIQKSSGNVVQRISRADQVTSEEFQKWLRYMNRERHEVYISMNALEENAQGRTKSDVAEIRHVYLDFDHNGTEAVREMLNRPDLPPPNHIIESSLGKYQTVWRVEDFEKDQAEALMRGMVQDLGADPAATDSSRVLRVPGFYNYKYDRPHIVRVDNLTEQIYQPSHFPEYAEARGTGPSIRVERISRRAAVNGITQSERDWAYARRALARGDDPAEVARAIEQYRTDKPNPHYYAKHTVEKALNSLNRAEEIEFESDTGGPDR